MYRYLVDDLMRSDDGVLRHPGGGPFTGWAFERNGSVLTGRLYADGTDAGPYQSPVIPSIDRYTILDVACVTNGYTQAPPFPGDPAFLHGDERFTGVTIDRIDNCETFWVDGVPVSSATHRRDLVELMRADGPIVQEYRLVPDGSALRLVEAEVVLVPHRDARLTLAVDDGTVTRRSIASDYQRLISAFRPLLFLPDLADESFLASIPPVGEPFAYVVGGRSTT